MVVIYAMKNILNGEIFYIGKTNQLLCKRKAKHKYKSKTHPNRRIYKYIKEHVGGWVNVEFIELTKVEEKEALIIEKEMMYEYGTLGKGNDVDNFCEYLTNTEKGNAVRVYKYETGEFVGEFPSYKKASIYLNIPSSHISDVVNGKRKYHLGYYFEKIEGDKDG